MSIGDKISGRVKQAAGDLAGDEDTSARAARKSARATAKEEAAEAENEAADKRAEAADLERKT